MCVGVGDVCVSQLCVRLHLVRHNKSSRYASGSVLGTRYRYVSGTALGMRLAAGRKKDVKSSAAQLENVLSTVCLY